MVKVAIKSEKLSPLGGIVSIMGQFDSNLSSVIDSTLGMRCRLYGYQLLLSGKTPKSIKSLPNIYIYMDMREKHASCPHIFWGMGTIKKNSSDFRGKQDL